VFEDNYVNTFPGQRPGTFSSFAYDAAILMFLAIARAGATDGTTIRNALIEVAGSSGGDAVFDPGDVDSAIAALQRGEDVDYTGASGPVDLDAAGDVVSDYEVWQHDFESRAFARLAVVLGRDL
jgi:hypothetical protein